MVTLKQSRKRSGSLCGSKTPPWEEFGALGASQTANNGEFIITGSFNGLMERIIHIPFFDVWLTGKKILKQAKKNRIEATLRMSEVLALTCLKREDVEFFVTLGLVSVADAGLDAVFSAKDVFCLVKIFERFLDEGVIV